MEFRTGTQIENVPWMNLLPPSIPNALRQLLHRLLREDPLERIQSATEVGQIVAPFCQAARLKDLVRTHAATRAGDAYAQDSLPVELASDGVRNSAKLPSWKWITPIGFIIIPLCWSVWQVGRTGIVDTARTGEVGSGQVAEADDSLTQGAETYEIRVDEDGREIVISARPGYAFTVQVRNANEPDFEIHRAWDLIELMLKHEQAFDLFQEYGWQNGQPGTYYPFVSDESGVQTPANVTRSKHYSNSAVGQVVSEIRESQRSIRITESSADIRLEISHADTSMLEYTASGPEAFAQELKKRFPPDDPIHDYFMRHRDLHGD